jgi:uncharacterized glyoxalase superfamily protein PhnB
LNTSEAPQPAVWLTIRSGEARALVDFLVAAFGFVEVATAERGGLIHHGELAWPEGGSIMVADEVAGVPWTKPPGSGSAHVVTADPDALHARAVAVGAEIVEGPIDREYGPREVVARDPDGNVWAFSTYSGAPAGGT